MSFRVHCLMAAACAALAFSLPSFAATTEVASLRPVTTQQAQERSVAPKRVRSSLRRRGPSAAVHAWSFSRTSSGVPAIGGDADGSVDPLSAVGIGRAVPVEQVTDAIAQVLENPPRDDRSSDLAARFGLEAFTAQTGALSASFMVSAR